MKITKVFYEKLFPTGSFLNERIGMEASIDEGDDPHQVLLELKERVQKSHVASNPDLGQGQLQQSPSIIEEKPIPADQRVAVIIADIYSCKEVKVLESYKLMVKGNEQLQAAYDQKFKELSQ